MDRSTSLPRSPMASIPECWRQPGAGYDETLAPLAEVQLADAFPGGHIALEGNSDPAIHDVYAYLRSREVATPAIAAINTALWDLRAKQAGMPLYRLLGLSARQEPTSVTIGLTILPKSPESACPISSPGPEERA